MRSAPPIFPGDWLTLDAYLADYESRVWHTDRSGCWKLERQQSFRELDNPSWDAAARGDWERATEILEQDRDNVRKHQREIRDHGFEIRRVRVVEKPYSPYLIWELNSLLIRHEFGERIRVLATENLHTVEKGHPLPEILVLGTGVVYRVIYDETGLPSAAIRCTLAGTVRSWAGFIRHLHDQGEDLPDFFAREIADLRPAYQP